VLRRAELEIAEIVQETADVRTFRLAAPPGGFPDFSPGQFLAVEVPTEAGAVRRSYSIATSPRERRHVDLTVREVPGGAASAALFRAVRAGDRVRASGPFGEFTLVPGRPALFVAGGVGITPIQSMLRTLDAEGADLPVALLYSCRTSRDVIFEREIREMARRRPAWSVHLAITRPSTEDGGGGWPGAIGRFDAGRLQTLCAGWTDRVAYLCGPLPMMEETGRALLALGFPAASIRTEAFLGTSPEFAPGAAAPTSPPAPPRT
jgi:ferredoxin-NADP reductase